MRVAFEVNGKTYTGEVIREARGSYKTEWYIEVDRVNKPDGRRDWTNFDEVGSTQIVAKNKCSEVN